MLNNKDYCDHETYEALKELGMPFYAETLCYQKDGGIQYTTPRREQGFLLYEAQKWLREEKKIEANAFYDNMDAAWRFYILEIDSPDLSGTHAYNDAYMSYEESLLEGIKWAIKLLKEE